MGATALIHGVNDLSISSAKRHPIRRHFRANTLTQTAFHIHPPASGQNSPSQMSSSTIGTAHPEPQHVSPLSPLLHRLQCSKATAADFLSYRRLKQHLAEKGLPSPRFPDTTIHLANFPPISAACILPLPLPYLNTLLSNQPPSPPYTINLPVSESPSHIRRHPTIRLQYLYTLIHGIISAPRTLHHRLSHRSMFALGVYPALSRRPITVPSSSKPISQHKKHHPLHSLPFIRPPHPRPALLAPRALSTISQPACYPM